MKDIEIHIDRIILDGIAGADPDQVRADVSAQLAVLIQDQGLPAQYARPGEHGRINVAPAAGHQHTTAIGAQIALSVYQGLSGADTRRLY